jgi:hypothetical protein
VVLASGFEMASEGAVVARGSSWSFARWARCIDSFGAGDGSGLFLRAGSTFLFSAVDPCSGSLFSCAERSF